MAITSAEYIKQLSIGYDLDGGGYTFATPTDPELVALPCVVWAQPDLDYTGGLEYARGRSADLLVFAPNSGHFEEITFPPRVAGDDGEFVKIGEWRSQKSAHDCNCRGRLVETSEAAGEPRALTRDQLDRFINKSGIPIAISLLLPGETVGWEFTGNMQDHAYPDCNRCDGEGFVPSHGGEWALYEWQPAEDEEDDDSAEHDFEDREDFQDDDAFADPGGTSALRAAGPNNPRNLPCPSCGSPNRLTPADRARGYQCDACADQDERGGY